jgi:hypothetical protein
MAYGLRYTITQQLRDEASLIVKIYEKSYVGATVTPYIGTNVSLVPNSTNEDPISSIISSQLNVSFIISDQDDYDNFPDLLNFDETKYYVELVINAEIKWRGFLLNDYVQVPFTTGNQEVSMTCIDGLSFLRYIYYDFNVNTNALIKLIDIIGTCLNALPFEDMIFLYACCSYYADGMFDRGDAGGDEPFSQTYQYNRDFYKLDYYTILENIIKTFGCRLFQSNGNWYILPMNQQADTIYYTRYVVEDVPTISGNGTLTNTINIQPYQEGNVHFVNNNQTKIVRKGYPTIEATLPYEYAANYIYNGTFKYTTGSGSSLRANGWSEFESGTSRATLVVLSEDQSNRYEVSYLGSGNAYIQNYFALPTAYEYLPKMYGTSASLSFEYQSSNAGAKIRVYITAFIGGTTYYLKSDDIWSTTSHFRDITYTTYNSYISSSIQIPMGLSVELGINIEGYIGVKFEAANGAVGGYIRNVKLTQGDASITEVVITRNIGSTSQIATDVDIPYSAIYPYQGASPIQNNVGLLFDEDGVIWRDWYRYGYPPEAFGMLAELIMRQYSNLLSKNIATLEGDLGAIAGSNGFIYLDKTYTIEDSSTNALSYNNKKFLINRLTSTPYLDETSQIQLLEITMVDNASTATIDYIGDVTIETPKRYFNNA